MEFRVLRYFLTIAQEENFTKAAEQLHLTQPTLSRQIAQLEEELGARLFLRGTHTVALTEEGMLLRRRAQELLSLADKTKQEVLSQRRDLEGVISIRRTALHPLHTRRRNGNGFDLEKKSDNPSRCFRLSGLCQSIPEKH